MAQWLLVLQCLLSSTFMVYIDLEDILTTLCIAAIVFECSSGIFVVFSLHVIVTF